MVIVGILWPVIAGILWAVDELAVVGRCLGFAHMRGYGMMGKCVGPVS